MICGSFTSSSPPASAMETDSHSTRERCSIEVNSNQYCRDVIEHWDDSTCDDDCFDCSLILIASTLLHELVHCCGIVSGNRYDVSGPSDASRGCDLAYMMGNAFSWAISQRYPWVLSADRCRSLASGCFLFFDGDRGSIPSGCAP